MFLLLVGIVHAWYIFQYMLLYVNLCDEIVVNRRECRYNFKPYWCFSGMISLLYVTAPRGKHTTCWKPFPVVRLSFSSSWFAQPYIKKPWSKLPPHLPSQWGWSVYKMVLHCISGVDNEDIFLSKLPLPQRIHSTHYHSFNYKYRLHTHWWNSSLQPFHLKLNISRT